MAQASKVLLFSIKPRWADAIMRGEKTFELRRRPPKLTSPVPALIYATTPVRALVGRCMMGPVLTDPPSRLWKRVSGTSCVTEMEFDDYFCDCREAHAIVVSEPSRIENPLSLRDLQEKIGFSAPQAWAWATDAVLAILGARA